MVDDKEVQSGESSYYSFFHELEPGQHTLCVIVDQPECPPLTQCVTVEGFAGGGSSERSDSEEALTTNLKVSNPSAGTIFFSHPINEGTATLVNLHGGLAKSFQLNNTTQLNVENLPQGQYVLRINTNKEVLTQLVIILPSSGK